jgi:hypothetical protein
VSDLDDGSSGAPPRALSRTPIERARASRARTRRLLIRTTLLTGGGVVILFALFPLRAFGPRAVEAPIEAAPPEPVDARSLDVPIVVVSGGRVLLDGTEVGATRAIAESGRITRIDGLFEALVRLRTERPQIAPGSPHRSVILALDPDTPAIVVKSVFQTATFAGYSDVSFLLRDAGAR